MPSALTLSKRHDEAKYYVLSTAADVAGIAARLMFTAKRMFYPSVGFSQRAASPCASEKGFRKTLAMHVKSTSGAPFDIREITSRA